ncbi:MAG TPA: hypothetical protein VE569_09150 [Acidimicrobiia bacterium]|nr:hypothetical protein [Acidimicrobiia bacterium]
MREMELRIQEVAASQRYLLSRGEVFDLGGDDGVITRRLQSGRWIQVHDGVYQIDRRPLSWESKLLAAVLACGPRTLVSHRAAMVLWGLDGISSAPVEVTMPFGNLGFAEGAIIHRTRRAQVPAEVRGIPVTTVERTLLVCSARLGKLIIGKALDSAIRKGLTTVDKCYDTLVAEGGRGVKGTKTFRWVIRERLYDTATDSGAEFELLYYMQLEGLPRPILHHEIVVNGQKRVLDLYFEELGKAVEVDGIDAHSSGDKLDDDLVRQNGVMDLGIEIRRFSARRIRREPKTVVAEIRKFLES